MLKWYFNFWSAEFALFLKFYSREWYKASVLPSRLWYCSCWFAFPQSLCWCWRSESGEAAGVCAALFTDRTSGSWVLLPDWCLPGASGRPHPSLCFVQPWSGSSSHQPHLHVHAYTHHKTSNLHFCDADIHVITTVFTFSEDDVPDCGMRVPGVLLHGSESASFCDALNLILCQTEAEEAADVFNTWAQVLHKQKVCAENSYVHTFPQNFLFKRRFH